LKLLLDTSYFLPAIGISIKGLPEDAPIRLIRKGYKVSISDITLFELSAKGARYITIGKLTSERVCKGIRAVVYDDRITKISMYDSSILLLAFRLRRILNDFIDCLILSSALTQNDILVTEDQDLQKLKEKREFQETFQTINPKFKIQKLIEMI